MCRRIDCRKKNYRLVRELAVKFAKAIEGNARLYYRLIDGIKIYDFEPAALNQHLETTLEIIEV